MFTRQNLLLILAGVIVGVASSKYAKTPKARKLAVKGLAKGMMIRDDIVEEFTNLKDEAEDIRIEAMELAKKNSKAKAKKEVVEVVEEVSATEIVE